ncbi:Carnosine N-methyltransferase [Pseudozyma hubeiensis]|nr:Carnosine N-methyltransferase [Pseudozyma hubeiensis]
MEAGSISHEEEEQRLERLHFANVLKAFDDYLPYCLSANDARRRSFFSLPRAHQQLLADVGQPLALPELPNATSPTSQSRGFKSRLEEIDDRIRRNADLLSLIADESRGFLGPNPLGDEEEAAMEDSQAGHDSYRGANSSNSSSNGNHSLGSSSKTGRKRRKISGHEIDKIQSTLKQFVRDWSREGEKERSAVYGPLMDAVTHRYGKIDFENRGHVRVLVPGAGLGRLAFEYAAEGYSCQGNEFSFYMLLASHYILNKSSQIDEHVIYPFVHSSSNWRTADDMLRSIRIPDVLPSSLPQTSEFSMVAGEFCEVYSKPDEARAWHVVATCFFIDTAKNVLRYLETLNHVLPIGGHWINAGPLLWHFEYSGNSRGGSGESLSIELTLDELIQLLPKMGFELEERRELQPTPYTGMLNGMLQYHYSPEFFVCRKVRDVEAAPAI